MTTDKRLYETPVLAECNVQVETGVCTSGLNGSNDPFANDGNDPYFGDAL